MHPAWELPAHHCLRDNLCGRTGFRGLLALSVDMLRDVRVETKWSGLGIQEGGSMELSVIKVPDVEGPSSSHPRWSTSHLLTGEWLSVGDHLDQLTITLEVHLEKKKKKKRFQWKNERWKILANENPVYFGQFWTIKFQWLSLVQVAAPPHPHPHNLFSTRFYLHCYITKVLKDKSYVLLQILVTWASYIDMSRMKKWGRLASLHSSGLYTKSWSNLRPCALQSFTS